MEFLLTTAAVLAFFAVVFCLEAYRAKQAEKRYKERIRSDYLSLSRKEYSADRFAKLNRYLAAHPEEGQIDEITWNDCGMDDLFVRMNYTLSAIGEEYLYYQLHSPKQKKEALENFDTLMQAVDANPELRTKMQFIFHKLGYMGKYSIYDYLDNLEFLGERSNKKDLLVNGLYLVCLGLMLVQFQIGIICCVLLMIYQIMTYFKEKSVVEPYVISFAFIQRMIACAGELVKVTPEEFAKESETIHRLANTLKPMNVASFLVMDSSRNRAAGDIIGMLIDYLKMIFHLDLLKFNSMYHFVGKHTEEIDQLITSLGYVESVINTWIFRQSLNNGWCVPRFVENKEILITEGYHPMLEEPVKNSISTKTGILLTGSNASGKSTFLKMVAINAILAQTIYTCAADTMEMPFFLVYSSMALRDDIQGGDSYYIVEIKALKRILDAAEATDRDVLCFVDEVLRGTNTVERIAASTEILSGLPSNTLCFAATHDIELTELLSGQYENYHFEEDIREGDIFFHYKLLPGKATTRNAIKLLELLGYRESLIQNAHHRAEHFLETGSWE